MAVIEDNELGSIAVHRSSRARQIRIRVAPNGTLRVSAPQLTPMFVIKRMINSSRDELAQLLATQRPVFTYEDGSEIGKSHSLLVRSGTTLQVKRQGLRIVVTLPDDLSLQNTSVQSELRPHIISALRREAKGYLPKRLEYLAQQHGFSYTKVRFSHASSRWGSCSSNGTISLNIALMKLPFTLIDYVLIHELSHTVHMNHSVDFWQLVSAYDPKYKTHRQQLKAESPTI